jgi:hypothetical protein
MAASMAGWSCWSPAEIVAPDRPNALACDKAVAARRGALGFHDALSE